MVRHTLKILQQMLQVLQSVPDHFATLQSNGLINGALLPLMYFYSGELTYLECFDKFLKFKLSRRFYSIVGKMFIFYITYNFRLSLRKVVFI